MKKELLTVSRHRLWAFTLAALIAVAFGGLGNDAARGEQNAIQGRFHVLVIQGMTCEKCAAHIQAAVAKVPSAADCSVSYPKAEAVICTKAGANVPPAALLDAVRRAGYKATMKH